MNYFNNSLKHKIILLVSVSIIHVLAIGQNVSITENFKEIKTYPFSDPNPLPAMAISKKVSSFYPYFMID